MPKLSFTMENYLEAIYELSKKNGSARISDIANQLGVTKASTNSAMSSLAERGLIVNEKYREVLLTPTGRELAERTSKKHHTLRRFFTEVLHVSEAVADTDACAIEHVISTETIQAMQTYLETDV